MPRKFAERLQLQHSTDQPNGVWYTLSKTIIAPYARCLLASSELREKHGIMNVPHYSPRPLQDYSDMLNGKPFVPTQNPRKRLALTFQPEFPDDEVEGGALGALEDVKDDGGS